MNTGLFFRLRSLSDPPSASEVVDCFVALDKDGSGEITIAELSEGFKRLGIELSTDETVDLFAAMDLQIDGAVNIMEFAQFILSNYDEKASIEPYYNSETSETYVKVSYNLTRGNRSSKKEHCVEEKEYSYQEKQPYASPVEPDLKAEYQKSKEEISSSESNEKSYYDVDEEERHPVAEKKNEYTQKSPDEVNKREDKPNDKNEFPNEPQNPTPEEEQKYPGRPEKEKQTSDSYEGKDEIEPDSNTYDPGRKKTEENPTALEQEYEEEPKKEKKADENYDGNEIGPDSNAYNADKKEEDSPPTPCLEYQEVPEKGDKKDENDEKNPVNNPDVSKNVYGTDKGEDSSKPPCRKGYGKKVTPEPHGSKPCEHHCVKKLTKHQREYREKHLGVKDGVILTPAKLARIRITQGCDHTLLTVCMVLAAIFAILCIYSAKDSLSCPSVKYTVAGSCLIMFIAAGGIYANWRVPNDVEKDDDGLETTGQRLLELYFHSSWVVQSMVIVPGSFILLANPAGVCLDSSYIASDIKKLGVYGILMSIVSLISLYYTIRIVTWYEISQSLGELFSIWTLMGAVLITITATLSWEMSAFYMVSIDIDRNSSAWLAMLISWGLLTAVVSVVGFIGSWKEDKKLLKIHVSSVAIVFLLYLPAFISLSRNRKTYETVESQCSEILKLMGISWFEDYFGCSKYFTDAEFDLLEFDHVKYNPQCVTNLNVSKEATAINWEKMNEGFNPECVVACVNSACCSKVVTALLALEYGLMGGGLWFLIMLVASIMNSWYLHQHTPQGKDCCLQHHSSNLVRVFIILISAAGIALTLAMVSSSKYSSLSRSERNEVCNFQPGLPINSEPPFSCQNGIQDGPELGIDCGGICPDACDIIRTDSPTVTTAGPTRSPTAQDSPAAPELNLIGSSFVQVNQSSTYIDAGAICLQNGTQLPHETVGTVNTLVVGNYTIQYACCDTNHGITVCAAPLVRIVSVVSTTEPPTGVPTLTLAPTAGPTIETNGEITLVLRWNTDDCVLGNVSASPVTSTAAPSLSPVQNIGIVGAGRLRELEGIVGTSPGAAPTPAPTPFGTKVPTYTLNDECASPSDLDLRLAFVSSTNPLQICSISGVDGLNKCGNTTHNGDGNLGNGNAQETIKIYTPMQTEYVVYIDNYVEDRPIENSGAQIDVYIGNRFSQTVSLPPVEKQSYDLLGLFAANQNIDSFKTILEDEDISRVETTSYRFARMLCINANVSNSGPMIYACPQYFHKFAESRILDCARDSTRSCESCSASDDVKDWYRDNDRDGYGAGDVQFTSCEGGLAVYSIHSSDCDDSDAQVHPGASDDCANNIDLNCDSLLSCTHSPTISPTIGSWYLDPEFESLPGAPSCTEVCNKYNKTCNDAAMAALVDANTSITLHNCQNAIAEAFSNSCPSQDIQYAYDEANYDPRGGGLYQFAAASGYAHCLCSQGIIWETQAPNSIEIKLNGNNPMVLGLNSSSPFSYNDAGADCFYNGTNITENLEVSGQVVNLASEGTYVVKYRCCNGQLECNEIERQVIVEESSASCSGFNNLMQKVPIQLDDDHSGGCILYTDFYLPLFFGFQNINPPSSKLYFSTGVNSNSNSKGISNIQGDCDERPESGLDRRVCYCE